MTGKGIEIIIAVAGKRRVDVDDMLGPSRDAEYVAARRECYRRLRTELGWSLPRIGRVFGRHHATVLYALRSVA